LFITAEEENYIKVKPGLAHDNYQVTVKIQVFDIFIDYTECIKQLGQVSLQNTNLSWFECCNLIGWSAWRICFYTR